MSEEALKNEAGPFKMGPQAAPNPAPPAASPSIEDGARSSLLGWGAGMLVIGLGLVGVGAGPEGAPIALAGLLNTIYGIHTFGRLGPDDEDVDAETAARARKESATWTGGLTALAGVLVAIDHHFGVSHVFGTPSTTWAYPTYGLIALGVARVIRAQAKKPAEKPAEKAPFAKERRPKRARVEKKPRMDKSRAP
jgi:hypothetical protein